jgi:hypothetical protein
MNGTSAYDKGTGAGCQAGSTAGSATGIACLMMGTSPSTSPCQTGNGAWCGAEQSRLFEAFRASVGRLPKLNPVANWKIEREILRKGPFFSFWIIKGKEDIEKHIKNPT